MGQGVSSANTNFCKGMQLIQKRRSHNISMLPIRRRALKTKLTRIVTHISNLNVKVLRESCIKIIKVVFSYLGSVCINLYSIVSIFIRTNKRGRSDKIRVHVFFSLTNLKFYDIIFLVPTNSGVISITN